MTENKTSTSSPSSANDLLVEIIGLKKGGELRSQQATAVEKISEAIDRKDNLLIEAPTGSGKTLAYMIPLIFHGSRAVISTATKQLSDQVFKIDVPFLVKSVSKVAPGKKFKATLLKGRENYYCYAKAEEQAKLSDDANSLFGMLELEEASSSKGSKNSVQGKGAQFAKEIKLLEEWSKSTKSGERSEAPAVSDQVWRQYSSTTAECPGRKICPLASVCFAEKARDDAKEADIVITNHAVVAHDFNSDGESRDSVFGDRHVFVFDELHELSNYLTNAWGTRMSVDTLKHAVKTFKTLAELSDADVESIEKMSKKFNPVAKMLDEGLIKDPTHLLGELLARIYSGAAKIAMQASKVAQDKDENERKRKMASNVFKVASELMTSAQLLMDDSVETVRWVEVSKDDVLSLNAAPLRVGPKLQQALAERDAVMVGTSATITVSGSFEIPVHNLGLDMSTTPYKVVQLDSPFDYKKQAMMYVPSPDEFPAPVGADRKEHSEAVRKEVLRLVSALGGRTLSLHTTTWDAQETAKFLREKLPKMNILLQGEAPPNQLIEQFKEDEESVLVATMGMWHGLDAPGATLSQVIMDKIPFKPMNEPLSLARQAWAEQTGRNGFMDVYVADANVMLAQGAGRLIRSVTDRGVISILDTRLISKPYGRSMLKSLPEAKIFQDGAMVVKALERLKDSLSSGD